MPHPRFTNEEIVRRGEEIYAARLRNHLENLYPDKIVIIDCCYAEEASREPSG